MLKTRAAIAMMLALLAFSLAACVTDAKNDDVKAVQTAMYATREVESQDGATAQAELPPNYQGLKLVLDRQSVY